MAQNSRFLESLVHDIPMYPFSSTPDGRIVAELHRGRQESRDFQERMLSIQERAITRLSDLHRGAMTVPASDFRSSEAARILGDVAYEMQNVYAAQERSAQGIEALGQATAEGFGQIHNDLRNIKGPDAPAATIGDLAREHDDGLQDSLCAYSKGILSPQAENEVRNMFAQRMAEWSPKAKEIEDDFRARFKAEGFEMTPAFKKALGLVKNPKTMLLNSREEVMSGIVLLANVAYKYQEPTLQSFVSEILRFFEQYRRAQQSPVSEELLMRLGQNRLLKPAVQNQVLKHYPETRDDASITTINYSLQDLVRESRNAIRHQAALTMQGTVGLQQNETMIGQGERGIRQNDELIREARLARNQRSEGLTHLHGLVEQGKVATMQRDMSNYHLASIVGNLADIKGGMVDFSELVEDFAGMVEDGLEQVNETLERGFEVIDQRLQAIQTEMVLTRTAVVAELRKIDESILYVGKGIISSIERTNELLAELVEIARNSKMNEARQHFEDGSGCLKTAEEMEHIEEAYQRFCKGIDAHGMTAENHYGAALSAELLGRLEEAKKRYVTLIARCGKDKVELKSQGQEGMARVEYKSGNLPEAAKQCKEAVNTNPQNFSAQFGQARYLALQGLWDDATKVLAALIQEKPDWYLKMKSDAAFSQIPKQYRDQFLENLSMSKGGKTITVKTQILDEVLSLRKYELAIKFFLEVIQVSPRKLIKKQIWRHPGYENIQRELGEKITQYLDQELNLLTARACYELAILLQCLGFNEAIVLKVLRAGIEQDPIYYKKTSNRKQQIFDKIAAIDQQGVDRLQEIFEKINLPNL